MAPRNRHNLAQRTTFGTSGRILGLPRMADLTVSEAPSLPESSTHSRPADRPEVPQINGSAIQRFLLNALPAPVLPVRSNSMNASESSEGMGARQARSGWTPRLITVSDQDPDVGAKAQAGVQNRLEDPAGNSDSKHAKGRDLKAAGRAASRLRTV